MFRLTLNYAHVVIHRLTSESNLANLSTSHELTEYLLHVDPYHLVEQLPPMNCAIGNERKGPCYFLWAPVIEGGHAGIDIIKFANLYSIRTQIQVPLNRS